MLELISIHINKTAGTSFEQILRANYNHVLRINTHDGLNKNRRSNTCDGENLFQHIPATAQVIHGHFKAHEVMHWKKEIPIITWLRHPVDRVISNYFYESKNGKTKRDLLGYASLKENRNRMSKMLEGACLSDLFFVGIFEFLQKDIARLGHLLGWKHRGVPRLNVTPYCPVYQRIKSVVATLNEVDMALYKEALNVRKAELFSI